MKLGMVLVAYGELPLDQALARARALGLDVVELGSGNYPGTAHCDPAALLASRERLAEFKETVRQSGLGISALSCHGNMLHPDPEFAARDHKVFVETIRLAAELGLEVVNNFSGTPGGSPADRTPNWITCPWPPEYGDALRWQWNEKLIPYWKETSRILRDHGVKVGLEMHPGFCVYNPESLVRLAEACGDNIGANFDPSHLFWQGIDPIVAVRALAGRIFHTHAKDVAIDRLNAERNGVLDTKPYTDEPHRSWIFRALGYGHGVEWWNAYVSALRLAGYDGALSIEHEDSLMSRDEGLAKAVALLRQVVIREKPGKAWWT